MKPEAAWRRWLDFGLCVIGLDEFANFQKRPAGTSPVQLEPPYAVRPEQVNSGEPPSPPAWPLGVARTPGRDGRPASGDGPG